MNTRLLKAILGKLLVVYGGVMGIPAMIALYCHETTFSAFTGAALVTVAIGIWMLKNGKIEGKMSLRESYLIVGTGWLLASILGALPFSLSGTIPDFISAVFETVSGLTTTGASVLDNLESLPQSILFWRSMTHWLGGMGIIVLFILLLPNLGMGAVYLFNAEVPGPTAEKVLPRVREGALYLWVIYAGLTLLQVILLAAAGMSVFDSINHALATMATGGFSTRTASIAAYDSLAIELIIVLFMVLAGVNFSLYIYAWRRGILSIFKDAEFRLYLLILLLSSAVISLALIIQSGLPIGTAVRHAVFQAASIMTTTGFASVNFDEWPGLAKLILFILMFIGGSAGSTAGGIKVARFLILFKISWVHLRQMLNPRLVTTINLQGKPVEPQVLISVTRFFFLFIMIFALAAVLLAGAGLEPFDAMSAVAATLGNVGPGFGLVGPMVNYAPISQFGKTVLIICMLLGRLELFAILVFTQPGFWKYTKAW